MVKNNHLLFPITLGGSFGNLLEYGLITLCFKDLVYSRLPPSGGKFSTFHRFQGIFWKFKSRTYHPLFLTFSCCDKRTLSSHCLTCTSACIWTTIIQKEREKKSTGGSNLLFRLDITRTSNRQLLGKITQLESHHFIRFFFFFSFSLNIVKNTNVGTHKFRSCHFFIWNICPLEDRF